MTDESDRYAVERRLAGQIESEWGDVLLGTFIEARVPAARRLGTSEYLAGPRYHAGVAAWIAGALAGRHERARAVDIGGGLGRFLFELLQQLPALESATHVEPSPTLSAWASTILTPGSTVLRVPFLTGLGAVEWHTLSPGVTLRPELLTKLRLVHGSVEAPILAGTQFDLVAALNVLDQCGYPSLVAGHILQLAAPDGFVVLSCTHQCQKHLFLDERTVFESLHDLFPHRQWRLIAETELPFAFRMGERHRNLFLSHHVLYQRVS
jgi:hypothetical protein